MTKEEFNEKVRRHNAAFAALEPEGKRVAIAKDVLRHLDTGRFRAAESVFVGENDAWIRRSDVPDELSANAFFDTLEVCDVCAVGALFVSAVGLADACNIGDVRHAPTSWDPGRNERVYFYFEVIVPYLGQFFEPKQLRLMELSFERGDGGIDCDGSDAEVDAMNVFRDEDGDGDIVDDETPEADRLRLMMECIMRNNGTYVPRDVRRP